MDALTWLLGLRLTVGCVWQGRKGEATEDGQRWCCCHKLKGAKCLVNQLGKKPVVPEECCWFLLSNYQLHILTL